MEGYYYEPRTDIYRHEWSELEVLERYIPEPIDRYPEEI